MNIKEIAIKALKESGVQANDWSIADRIADANSIYLRLIEKSVQIGSKVPISKAEATSETFTVVEGSNTFTRTIKDVPIVRVDFAYTGSTLYQKVDEDQSRAINGWHTGESRFFANEKQMFVEEGRPGTLRVTYARGGVTLFTAADYDLGTPPSPDFLPETYHDLLWLRPAYRQAKKFKKDSAASLIEEINELQGLFDNHYGRDAVQDLMFSTEEEERGNNR